MRRKQGLTLLELLIGTAILIVVLLVVSQLFLSTRVSYEVNEEVSAERQNVETAAQILKYDLSLGGYRSIDAAALGRTFTCTFEFTDGASGTPDQIKAWYYEDRFVASTPELRAVRFFLAGDALMREENGAATEVVAGLEDLQFIAWHNRSIQTIAGGYLEYAPPSAASADDFAGYQLMLTFAGGEQEVVSVALTNPQVIVTGC